MCPCAPANAWNKPGSRSRLDRWPDPYDNAMAEALSGTFKAELIEHQGPWATRAQVEHALLRWVGWYNHGITRSISKHIIALRTLGKPSRRQPRHKRRVSSHRRTNAGGETGPAQYRHCPLLV
ncbi:integrase core domain-containing protein [Nocardiopsis gilva]